MSKTFQFEVSSAEGVKWRAILAEFIGTIILVFSIVAAAIQIDAG